MNIRRLFRWLEQVSEDSLYGIAQRCRDHLRDFSLSKNEHNGLSFVLGGMVGPLACLRVKEANCSQEEANRIVALAMEGAARLGMAYSFHPRKENLTSLCEDLISCALLGGKNLEDVAGCMCILFSSIPKAETFSNAWFQEIRNAVDDVIKSGVKENGELSENSLSIEPLYQQQRFLCETLICAPYDLSFTQLTTAFALDSILSRHIKAAGKRLRVDQVKALEIELLSGVMDDSLREHLAAKLLFYPEPILPSSDWSPKRRGEIENLMHIIQIEERDWDKYWDMEYKALGRLYMTSTKKEREAWIVRSGQLSWLKFMLMERMLINHVSIEEYSFIFPVSLRLHTSRGGCWKEKIERLQTED